MTATIEFSLYPLHNEYPASVVAFLKKLDRLEGIEMKTNGMSTILIGPYERLWNGLGNLMEEQFNTEDCVFVMKIAHGRREYE